MALHPDLLTTSSGYIGDHNLWNKLVYGNFYPIFNVAVGGNMGGDEYPDASTASGLAVGLEVDYFAVYRST